MLNDSAVLDAYIYSSDDATLIPQASIHSVTFSIILPSNTTGTPDVTGSGTVVADGHGQFVVPGSDNTVEGQYKGIATFTYDDGTLTNLVKSIPVDYDVLDPFVRTGASAADGAVRQCWMKLEDCFDSEQGGPWLRDMTLAVFDQTKVRGLIPEVLLEINNQMPFTAYTADSFPYTNMDGEALFAQGLLVSSIRHLMRAYVEQPTMANSPVGFAQRNNYQTVWKAQYDVEMERFKHWLNRWKLQTYDLSGASVLLGTKAGRMIPGPMRSRNAGFGWSY